MSFQLKDYDPSQPAVFIHRDGQLQWFESPQAAKFMYYYNQDHIITGPGDFDRLPIDLTTKLLKEYDATSYDELWHKLRLEYEPPEEKRSTVRTRRHGLHVNAAKFREFKGPKQAVHIALWLADQHDGETLDDLELERSIDRMQRLHPMKTKQSAWLVFRYYRALYIREGCLREV